MKRKTKIKLAAALVAMQLTDVELNLIKAFKETRPPETLPPAIEDIIDESDLPPPGYDEKIYGPGLDIYNH